MGRTLTILALAAIAGGCPAAPNPQPTTAPTAGALQAQIEDLQAENLRLKAEVQVLEQDKEYLRQREGKLSIEARYIKFLNEQQAKQLEALSGVPAQRDYYRSLAEKLAAEREDLLKQIRQLKGGGAVKPPESQPVKVPTPTTAQPHPIPSPVPATVPAPEAEDDGNVVVPDAEFGNAPPVPVIKH